MKQISKSFLPMFLIVLLSVSCGGGGNGNTDVAGGGIGGTGITQGSATAIGSVTVNGEKINTDSATFIIDDGAPFTTTEKTSTILSKGMQVKVHVDDTGNTATQVEYEPDVEGPIDDKIETENKLVVLGRTVIIDDSTTIEDDKTPTPTSLILDQLSVTDMLEVSGLVFPDDKLQATYIRRLSSTPAEFELKGTLTGKGPTTFLIGAQSVDFVSGSPTFVGIADASELVENLFVEVKGTRVSAAAPLIATRISKEDDLLGAKTDDKVEIEGLVTLVTAVPTATIDGLFSVSGQSVTTNTSTLFEDGATDDVALNIRLEVEGTITGGVLVATKVKFHGNRIKIEANGTPKGSNPNSVVLLGKTVVINGATQLDDKKTGAILFSNITDGDRLEIRGYLSNGIITATRVERNNDKQGKPVILQAPVDVGGVDSDGQELTLLGVKVDTTTSLTTFQDISDFSISSTDFFSQVKDGTLVKAKGSFAGGIIDAEEVGFED